MSTKLSLNPNWFTSDLNSYKRRETIEVKIGNSAIGGKNPIRIQSMTTIDTLDTNGSVEQCIRMIESGCEYIRITAPSIKEAANLENIKNELRKLGYDTPLIADIHFTPNAAEVAAKIVEKVRINPGNYVDKKKFEVLEYDDITYQNEIDKIKERFTPLVNICKEYGTAMRIGTNHGSLSDRIMSRYGDTPFGMVESAMEFIRICNDLDYHQIVISMKSSNPQVMIQAYRLLVHQLEKENLPPYPLHLGVTEAGEGEDGRIKSALGIGTLLEDGLGDTIRVSLTEEPEFEAPVAKALADRYETRTKKESARFNFANYPFSPFDYSKKKSIEVLNFGGTNVPRVISDYRHFKLNKVADLKSIGHFYLPEPDKWAMNDQGSDYIYTGSTPSEFMLPNGLREIIDYSVWLNHSDKKNTYPLVSCNEFENPNFKISVPFFLTIKTSEVSDSLLSKLKEVENLVICIVSSTNLNPYQDLRSCAFHFHANEIHSPLVFNLNYSCTEIQKQLFASTDLGALLTDGFGDGVLFESSPSDDLSILKSNNQLAFGILHAARTRITKTEYISCPSCGRTLFDLQETTAKIRKRTDHLKGIKIGIMGCIVNGPGEMADADYGYVGSGKDKITLYRGQNVVKRSVPSSKAVDELIKLIQEDGLWIEQDKIEKFV